MKIILTKNIKSQAKTKYIDVQHHYIQEFIADKKVVIEWLYSTNMLAAGFMKSLSVENFKRH